MKHTQNAPTLSPAAKSKPARNRTTRTALVEACEPRQLFAAVSGTVFNDLNANGTRDAGETPLANWSVFIDANNDGGYNGGEKLVKTDAAGKYTFTGLAAGMYRVREVVQSGYTITSPTVSNPFNLTHQYDFNGSYADVYGGKPMVPAGGSMSGGTYNFAAGQGPSVSDAVNGSNYTIAMRVKLQTVSGYRSLIDFKNRSTESALYVQSGKLYFYPVTGAISTGTPMKAGQFHDVVLSRDAATKKVVGYVDGAKQFEFTDTGSAAVFSGPGSIATFVRDNANENSAGALDQVRIFGGPLSAAQVGRLKAGTNPAPTSKGYYVDVPTSTSTITGRDFGNTNRGVVSGYVWADNNSNGVKDAGESPRAGVRVYLDKDNDNAYDASEVSAITDAAGNYKLAVPSGTGQVRVVTSGEKVTSPASGEYAITAATGQQITGKNFGLKSTATVAAAHDYQLNGSFADKFGGSSMVGAGGTLSSTGYTFGAGKGPSVSNAFTNAGTYSIEIKFKLNEVSNYRSIMHFANLAGEASLYVHNGALNFYPFATGASGAITAGTTTHLVVTRDAGTKKFTAYVNGVKKLEFTDSSNGGLLSGPNKIVHFFRDNGNENGTGFLDYVRTYNKTLSQAEVTTLKNNA